ncbi:hypothetical protein O3G_MSEX014824, partial [Manduca sexta]
STVISLAIVILLATSPTNGFTIHRNQEKTETEAADLVVAESTLLEVKNDLNRPNDIKAFEITKHEGLDKTQTTENFRNKYSSDEVKSKHKLIEKGEKTYAGTLKSNPELTTDYSKERIQLTTSEYKITLTTATNNGKSDVATTRNSETTAAKPGTEVIESDNPYTSTQLTSVSTVNNPNRNETKELTTAIIKDNSEGTTVFNHINLGAEVNALQDSTSLDETGFTFEDDNKNNQTFLNKEKFDSSERALSSPEVTSEIIETARKTPIGETGTTFGAGLTTALATEELTKAIQELSTVLDNTSGIIDLIPILNATNASTEASTPSDFNTRVQESSQTKDQSSVTTTEPSWRKYTIIDRKRMTTPEVTTYTSNEEIPKAETSSTRISLEEALAVTPIASLERLREDLIANKNKLAALQELSTTERNFTSGTESSTATPPLKKPEGKVGMVSSMRAGFLDYSGKSSSQEKTTTEQTKETFRKLYDSEAGEIDRLTQKYGNDVESQSQLAEDAMKEELLKEAMFNDNVVNAQRYRDDRAHTEGVEPSLTTDLRTALDSLLNIPENKTSEDALNVQPISQEQGKNIDLYAVSPNYKPMKRIEVQPAKPFVRDPDDNSWRNESISSLGIVFKPKNSSKSFTQVLKNKTENVLSSLADRDSKNGVPDLRERLEKIAEVRKSKKKRINKFGETVYSDYEESSASGESFSTPKTETTTASSSETLSTNTTIPPISTTEHKTTQSIETKEITKEKEISETIPTPMEEILKLNDPGVVPTRKPSKFYNIAEYYDTTDEYDADYLSLSKIDLKKFTIPFRSKETVVTPAVENLQTKPHYPPDRKPTIQYFPPRVVAKVNVHDYDEDFNRKVNQYTLKDVPKSPVDTTFRAVTSAPNHNEKVGYKEISNKPTIIPHINPIDINKKLYEPHVPPQVSQAPPHLPEQPQGFAVNNGDYNRGSYVIKHYGDFINEAAKDDDDRNSDYVVLTEPPIRGITVDELAKLTTGKPATIDDVYDYETQFRKDILNRFVENFNQNSERFKVDFPILYNNSIVHRNMHDNGRGLASSSAFMKRLYNDAAATKPNYLLLKKPCEPNCDKVSVELSPAYELHYYVPDQEEKEEVDPRAATAHYRYRL